MPSAGCSGVKHTLPLDSGTVQTFSGVKNHAAISGSLMDEPGFGGCEENATYENA